MGLRCELGLRVEVCLRCELGLMFKAGLRCELGIRVELVLGCELGLRVEMGLRCKLRLMLEVGLRCELGISRIGLVLGYKTSHGTGQLSAKPKSTLSSVSAGGTASRPGLPF